MITVQKELNIEPTYDFARLAPKERIVFFDIETTGLTAAKASLYLIGTVSFEEGHWNLRQFFAESLFEEEEMLSGFFSLLRKKQKQGKVILISYNGDGFDIPFIRNCIRQYHLPYDLNGVYSVDLLKKVRPFKGLMELPDCKLKTVEKICGIEREDRYSGGELIYVYEEYLRLSSLDPESCEYTPLNLKLKDHLLETLLLHNAEDIADMPLIMDVLGYESLLEGEYDILSSSLSESAGSLVWDIHARLHTPLPKGIYKETPEYVLSISEEDPLELNLAVPLYEGELKYFFVDHKNYYYLPAEDCAVHKSVGEFVDRKARKQATARTCYQKKQGRFVPQPSPVFTPVFYREYKGTPYGELPGTDNSKTVPEDIQVDSLLTKKYVAAVLEKIRS